MPRILVTKSYPGNAEWIEAGADGTVLVVDSTQPYGLSWGAAGLPERHHINMPEAPNDTVEYKGWSEGSVVLSSVKVICDTANTQGTLLLSITNDATGNSVLSGANLNLNSTLAGTAGVLTDDTLYSVALTSTESDLTFSEDDRWTISLESNDAGMDAAGIYISLLFEAA